MNIPGKKEIIIKENKEIVFITIKDYRINRKTKYRKKNGFWKYKRILSDKEYRNVYNEEVIKELELIVKVYKII